MSDTPEEREFELRAHIGAIWSGGRLFIGMYTFLLASLAFSYFYLRSSNNGLLWRPDHVTAPTAYGWTIYSLTLLAALMAIFGQSRLRKRRGVGLADGGVGRRGGVAARPVPTDLGVHRGALLSRFERLRIDVHRLLGHQHHDDSRRGVLARDDRRAFASVEEGTGR